MNTVKDVIKELNRTEGERYKKSENLDKDEPLGLAR